MIDHLGKYEIIRSLGNGAMGEVYLAHHPVIGREVAIKTILPGVAKGEDAEARFRPGGNGCRKAQSSQPGDDL